MRYLYFRKNRYKIIFSFAVGLLLLFYSEIFYAREISPEEALQWGIEHNHDLQNIRYSIEDLQRNLKILEAGKDFQVDLSITPIWRFGEKSTSFIIEMEKNRFTPDATMSLSAKKLLAHDLSFTSQITWQSENLTDHFLEAIANEVNASIRLDKKIYPDTWDEQRRQVYSLENNLQMKLEELRWKEMEKQIEFIQKYLNISRLQEQVDIINERLVLAEEELARVKEQIELGEGGYQQETEAIIAVEEIKNKLWSATQELTQAQKQWFILLNLPKEVIVDFNSEADFLQKLVNQMENLSVADQAPEELINQALQKNYQIKNSILEKEELLKELQWTKDAGKPVINLSGGYAYPGSEWFIIFDFAVNLADGGAQELKVKQREENIKRKDISIDYLIKTLRLEVEQLLDQDLYNQLFLQTQLKVLEKEQNKVKIIEQQYQQGAISVVQWKNSLLTLKEKELSVKQAYDQWLVDRLKLAHFVGYLQKGV